MYTVPSLHTFRMRITVQVSFTLVDRLTVYAIPSEALFAGAQVFARCVDARCIFMAIVVITFVSTFIIIGAGGPIAMVAVIACARVRARGVGALRVRAADI